MKYIIIKSSLLCGDILRTCYGIAVVEICDGVPIILQTVSDISASIEKLGELVELCNELDLDPIHLNDVVDDYLANT